MIFWQKTACRNKIIYEKETNHVRKIKNFKTRTYCGFGSFPDFNRIGGGALHRGGRGRNGNSHIYLFGKEIAYTLAEEGAEDGIKLSDETLSGLPVIESISDNFYTLTLNKEGTGYKNIKLSYKFKEPNLSNKAKHTSNIWGPVIAQLCKTEANVYSFGQSYWAQDDMTFIGSKEGQIRDQWGGKGSEKWHSVDFTVYENRFSIIFDGICWYRGDLKSADSQG